MNTLNPDQARRHIKRPRSLRTVTAPNMRKTGVALSISTAMLLPMSALAAEQEVELKTLKVEDTAIDPNPNAEPGVPYKAKYSGDQRRTKPLAETPATVQVLTAEAIKDSGYTDLREILDSQPGITLGTGENGNAFGDRYIIRGQEARSDVFVDGLRDPGMSIRESFAVEQVEISKGPNSSFAGRGTAGGAVNAITKQATQDYDFTRFSTAFGTDKHTRVTVDANQRLTDTVAVRANVLHAYEEVPDRDPADRDRKGVALSTLITPADALDITLDYYNLRADDKYDMGGFLEGTLPNRKPYKNPPVYVQEEDFIKSDVETFSARVNYAFNDSVRLSNLTRYGETDNGYVVTGAGVATGYIVDEVDPTIRTPYSTISLGTHQGWQDVEYLANQTNLLIDAELAGMRHAIIVGVEYSDHQVLNGVYRIQNSGQNCITSANATVVAPNNWCLQDTNGNYISQNFNTLMNRQIEKGAWDQDWSVKTVSTYIMDTIDLTDRWTLFTGIRHDRLDFALKTQNTTTLEQRDYEYSDTLIDAHIGATYRINAYGNVYFSYATASDINGGESDVGTNSNYGGAVIFNGKIAGADPEKSELYELGTKWNLMDERLLLTAALFQIDKSDIMEGVAGYTAEGSFNTGENRVQGIELGLVGQVTEKLTAQAGIAVMDAEVTKAAVLRGTGDDRYSIEGETLSNFAEESAFAQLKYAITDAVSVGAAAKYESEKYAGQPDTAPAMNSDRQYTQAIPDYTVYDLFATYRANKQLDFRLNVGNVTDEDYYLAGYQSGRFLYKGDARNYVLTVNYEL
jgi:catecholate siderophore receptor